MLLSDQKTSSDAGKFLLREVLGCNGVIESFGRHLIDDRAPVRVRQLYPPAHRMLNHQSTKLVESHKKPRDLMHRL